MFYVCLQAAFSNADTKLCSTENSVSIVGEEHRLHPTAHQVLLHGLRPRVQLYPTFRKYFTAV